MTNPINIGILGLGVVGGGAVRVLTEHAAAIERKVGAPLVIKKIAVRDLNKPRDIAVDPALLTDDPNEVIADPDIRILCELIGGVEPAHGYVLRAIQSGKNIVTANKEMMAKAGNDLLQEAEERGLDFSFEGSVGGGIPIIQPLKQALAANKFTQILGIVNGTTNYILSKMTAEDADFGDVLREAQAHGYAEADPTNDIEGYDAQYKTAILASIAFTSRVDPADIYVEGLTRIAKRDIEVAKELGYVIKIVGIGQDLGDALQVRVHPVLLPQAHPLASVNDVYNAIFLHGDAVGDVMFYGRGAGGLPTGSAVVGDIIEIARNIRRGATGRLGCTCYDQKPILPIDQLETNYYVRLLAHDRPKVLASLASIFGDFDVSIESVVQRALPDGDAEIVWITHRCLEANLRSALDVISRLEIVTGIQNWIRVEE
ncbi:MAG: homoserine dehydrogenase [Armatimonadetes bacterium]|nr:homoserine dehydrogenase [Armatimonadota bacterium]